MSDAQPTVAGVRVLGGVHAVMTDGLLLDLPSASQRRLVARHSDVWRLTGHNQNSKRTEHGPQRELEGRNGSRSRLTRSR